MHQHHQHHQHTILNSTAAAPTLGFWGSQSAYMPWVKQQGNGFAPPQENGINGISGINAMNGINGINAMNAVNAMNGINGINGMSGISSAQMNMHMRMVSHGAQYRPHPTDNRHHTPPVPPFPAGGVNTEGTAAGAAVYTAAGAAVYTAAGTAPFHRNSSPLAADDNSPNFKLEPEEVEDVCVDRGSPANNLSV
jgi:hypothetical protein